MTKLLVNASNPTTSKTITANPVDYIRFVDELTNWLGIRFEIVGTNRYTLDMHHELSQPTKVRGARSLAQSIVDSGATLVTQANLNNWDDMDIIDWLEARGYTWDTDLLGWVVRLPL